jgi:signal peptidase I
MYYNFNLNIIVPEDSYFFIGDNRDHSEDSRFWGFVKKDRIRGKAMFIWLSFDWNYMFTPSWIRYNRLGKSVK